MRELAAFMSRFSPTESITRLFFKMSRVMKRVMAVCLAVLVFNSVSMANVVFIDDGLSHTVNDSTYQNDTVLLDHYSANNPGTHVNLVDGGMVKSLNAENNSTIHMTGGSAEWLDALFNSNIQISGGSVGCIHASHNATIAMSGGTVVGADFIAGDNSAITITGGSIGADLIVAINNSTITISGGEFSTGSVLIAQEYGTIYLNGTNFEVGGTPLVYGDRLSQFGTPGTEGGGNYETGLITGILADGSALSNTFEVWYDFEHPGDAEIFIIPEPATFLLLGFGVLALSRRKR